MSRSSAALAFLLARIAEDEAAARSVIENKPYFQQIAWGWFDADFGDFHPAEYGKSGVGLPARVLAECEAKRRTIDFVYAQAATVDDEWGCCHDADVLRAGRRSPEYEDDTADEVPDDCLGELVVRQGLAPLVAVYSGRLSDVLADAGSAGG